MTWWRTWSANKGLTLRAACSLGSGMYMMLSYMHQDTWQYFHLICSLPRTTQWWWAYRWCSLCFGYRSTSDLFFGHLDKTCWIQLSTICVHVLTNLICCATCCKWPISSDIAGSQQRCFHWCDCKKHLLSLDTQSWHCLNVRSMLPTTSRLV